MKHSELTARIDEGRAFLLHVSDGRSFHIPHRDFLWLPPRSTAVIVADPSENEGEEVVTHIIPLQMISGVSSLDTAGAVDNAG